MDLNSVPDYGFLGVHYGSPLVTDSNIVIVPVRTTESDSPFELQIRDGVTGSLNYLLKTDYIPPPSQWVVPYGPVLSRGPSAKLLTAAAATDRTPRKERHRRLYYPGAGETVYFHDLADTVANGAGTGDPTGQAAFYGNMLYENNRDLFRSAVQISTPLTADGAGNLFFGYAVQGVNPASLTSGIARLSSEGFGSWVSARDLAGGDNSITQVALNCASALSNDGKTLYVVVSTGGISGTGYLVALDSITLAPIGRIQLTDPTGGAATISSNSSASPMVGPDGDVYFGVLESNCCRSHGNRGWMLHFDAALLQIKIPGSFGWDVTASVVHVALVPSYSGASPYLILTKYNSYAGIGMGTGVNKMAILDPNVPMPDEFSPTPVTVMREVLTITGVTPEPGTGFHESVKEWCVNTVAIDPFTRSAIVNSEDGFVYRWDFNTNSFTERYSLTSGTGEAYTPTLIGPDGTVYALSGSLLFALGK